MDINGVAIMLTEEDRNWLKLFFQNQMDFIENNSLLEYKNIQEFGNLYEAFLEENSLSDHDVLKLFLAEIRYDQLSYKITDNTHKMSFKKSAVSKIKLNDTIRKWYNESQVTFYISTSDKIALERNIQEKLLQNKKERIASWETSKDIIVK